MKNVHIQTFGCQMNEHDSQRMKEILSREGYEHTENTENAHLILLNSCSIRENPENKIYSQLGRLREFKKQNKNVIIGVGGCVAQQEGDAILKREKTVDMVFGTDNYFRLPEMIKAVQEGKRIVQTGWMPKEKKVQNFIPETELRTGRVEGCKAFISITKGCNNYCAFCIVPTTRGREVSRGKDNILIEAQDLINKGAKEIMLLGQNVNSYFANGIGFYALLKEVANLSGLKRLRFTSPHPNDWNDELSDLILDHPVICKQLHLPFQAGSDRILKAMRRGHTIDVYLNKMKYLKSKNPEFDLSTDVIVGFPGESNQDFLKTMEVLKTLEFQQVYAFKYSQRPGTRAAKMKDDVPKQLKEKRLSQVLKFQKDIQSYRLQKAIGRIEEILIDGIHTRERFAMTGRTTGNVAVTLQNCNLEIGDLTTLKIMDKRTHSLVA